MLAVAAHWVQPDLPSTCVFPSYWTLCPKCPLPFAATKKFHLINVRKGEEFDFVVKPLVTANFQPLRLKRIQNESLFKSFSASHNPSRS
eukprot:m.129777 g.129777  ORF g.129777 m.129777 type:complete len:89 (+) comp37988_c0_seq25:58-324(+)